MRIGASGFSSSRPTVNSTPSMNSSISARFVPATRPGRMASAAWAEPSAWALQTIDVDAAAAVDGLDDAGSGRIGDLLAAANHAIGRRREAGLGPDFLGVHLVHSQAGGFRSAADEGQAASSPEFPGVRRSRQMRRAKREDHIGGTIESGEIVWGYVAGEDLVAHGSQRVDDRPAADEAHLALCAGAAIQNRDFHDATTFIRGQLAIDPTQPHSEYKAGAIYGQICTSLSR